MLIGICGLIGSGKDTIADHLVEQYNFKRDSFAAPVKDVLSAVFGWDREMLEGRTKKSRDFRDQLDLWWANRLHNGRFTPRWAMQHIGTELFRNNFFNEIWIASLEHRIKDVADDVVISDCRFKNEIEVIKRHGGKMVWVRRGPLPHWYNEALETNLGHTQAMHLRSEVHPSEWDWIGSKFDYEIENSGTIEELYAKVRDLVADRPLS